MADSAPTTVNIKKEIICPKASLQKAENKRKLRFNPKKMISSEIKINKILYLLIIIPKKPIKHRKVFTTICLENIIL